MVREAAHKEHAVAFLKGASCVLLAMDVRHDVDLKGGLLFQEHVPLGDRNDEGGIRDAGEGELHVVVAGGGSGHGGVRLDLGPPLPRARK